GGGSPSALPYNRCPFRTRHRTACTMSKAKDKAKAARTIAVNRKARHDYFIEETFEAGLVREGWEDNTPRACKAQLTESYVHLRNGEAWLLGAHITPLPTGSTHVDPDPTRTRKLLLQRGEIDRLVGAVERKGYALVALDLHWTKGRAKVEI